MPQKRQTETEILTVSQALIQQRGVTGFSFADVAQAVNIRKASIYYYFPNKLSLVEGVLDAYIQHFMTDLHALDLTPPLPDLLTAYAQLYRRNLVDHQKICLCSMLALETPATSPTIRTKVNGFFRDNVTWLTAQLQAHQISAAATQAQAFFTTLQGAQLLTRSTQDLANFDQTLAHQLQTF
ncbi:TetR/AcrR family transcriptional regulator [Levilactobacillus acidifarinae]|uniref:HTH tetR-type domain-containing protein n=1 Tax=Levilactobacillus acidifarinae DSM 19394 = JCM 15949 TaxID=1423715 RepID=A0A0R1LWS9_9LACO|nr:TetR/AcrR family transcriptional regulator [Levilactobacillus acidifarinae]KRK96167.1 hypothetical protein FD25_GL002633 [Levilactobacillus acidifarinae DSM 19394]GEO69529.1 hypothetical protein LAC03_14390 [Levilactobacillus acidifarinae]